MGENTPFAEQSKEKERDKGHDNTLTPSVPTSIHNMFTFVAKESNYIKFFSQWHKGRFRPSF